MLVAPIGGAVGGVLFQIPFRIPFGIMAMTGRNLDPRQNKLALCLLVTGAAATEVGFCLGSAYTVKLIGKTRGYDGSWSRAAIYSLIGGGTSIVLTGGALLIRKKMDAVSIPVFIVSAGFFPTVGAIIGYHSGVKTEASALSLPFNQPQPVLKYELIRFNF